MSNYRVGQNIDWLKLSPSVAQYLRSQGFSPKQSADHPMITTNRKDLETIGVLGKPPPKPSKPRGPSEPEKEFHARALAYGLFQAVNYQPPNPFLLEGNTSYQPDFSLRMPCGLWIIVETKGRKVRGEGETRLKLRQCSERYPGNVWWLARWHPRQPWRVQEVVNGVIKRKPIEVAWLNGRA
jgi:hypothetical protein